jgi:hypothetical protein
MRIGGRAGTLACVNDRKETTMATTTKRRIGTFGTVSRVLVGVGLLLLALWDGGLSFGLRWSLAGDAR